MKRTLAVALSTLASTLALATGAQAQANSPQPSFIDHVPLEQAIGPTREVGNRVSAVRRQDLPQPSFVHFAAIEDEQSSAGGSTMHMATHDFPKPSFVDYPDLEATDPLQQRAEYAKAGR